MLVWVAIGWGAAVIYWRYTPPTYESSVQLMVMRKNPNVPATGVQQTNELESSGSEDVLATHMQIVQSERNVSEALARNDLDQLPSIQRALDEDETPTEYVIDNLEVTRGGDGQAKSAHVLSIAFRHGAADDAQQIVQAITDQYREFLKEQFKDVNEEAASLIARARGDLETELKAAENAYVQSRESTPLLWNGQESNNAHRTRYEQIQNELSSIKLKAAEARSRLKTVQSQIEELEESDASALERLALIDESSLARVGVFAQIHQGKTETTVLAENPGRQAGAQAEFSSLMSLLQKEEMLMEDYGANHPTVSAIREQIRVVKEFLREREAKESDGEPKRQRDDVLDPDQLLDSYVRLLESNLSSLIGREKELEQLAAQEQELAKTLVAYELEDQTLRQQIERKRQLYDTVVQRLSEINLAGDYGGFINEIIAPAQIGEVVWPKLPLCLALGVFLGLMLGSGSAVLAELADRSFHSPDDVVRTLNLPLLAQIDNMRARKKAMVADSAMAGELRAFHRPKSRHSEAFRSLRTSVFFTAQAQDMQTIAGTSPNQGDGKSTVLANLAISMAQAGRRVLLIDCDMRCPRVHELFGLDNSVGLSEVLGGTAEPWETVQATEMNKLWALPCGTIPGEPAEMLDSRAFRDLLDAARERYDFVLLDTPPVLAVSDPRIVSAQADGVMLVLRVSQGTRPQAVHALDLLSGIGANVVGAIVNAWDAGREFRYGEYGYHYARYRTKNGYYRDDEPPKQPLISNGQDDAAAAAESRTY